MRVTLCRRDRGTEQTLEGGVGQWEGCSATAAVAACSITAAWQDGCRSRAVTLQQHASRRTHVSIGNDGRGKPLNSTGKALALKPTEILLLTGLQGQDCSIKAVVHHFISIILNECSLEARCPF